MPCVRNYRFGTYEVCNHPLPSGRDLVYVRPRVGENRFGGESITYLGIDAKHHWAEVESYGPKFVENCVGEGCLVINSTVSDEQLAAMMKDHGYPIARRTVSKYREQMGIPVARLRK